MLLSNRSIVDKLYITKPKSKWIWRNKSHVNKDGLPTALINVGPYLKGCGAVRKDCRGSGDLFCI